VTFYQYDSRDDVHEHVPKIYDGRQKSNNLKTDKQEQNVEHCNIWLCSKSVKKIYVQWNVNINKCAYGLCKLG